jgi:hypothetical protein
VISFDASDAHFDKSSLFRGTQAKNVGNPKEKKKTILLKL